MAQFLILIGCAILLITVSGQTVLFDAEKCMNSEASQSLINDCQKTSTVVPGFLSSPLYFYLDNKLYSYCRTNQAGYIQYAVCYRAVYENCLKDSDLEEFVVSESELKEAITYFCDSVNDGFFDINCTVNQTEFEICNKRQIQILNIPSDPTTYEENKLSLCGELEMTYICIRDNSLLKTMCPESQITFYTSLQKAVPPVCKKTNGGDRMVFNYMSMIIVYFCVSFI